MENNRELAKTYSPKEIEKKWYQTWLDGGYFKPKEGKKKEPYCIIMPPPNVTGRLHMGHALDITTQDVLTRFKRMKGFETLWLPGLDHAGISTQSVVSKLIEKEDGKTIYELGREEFLKRTWQWKEEYGNIILDQQKTMGASCDWDYLLFTMDKGANQAVKKFFVDLYNEGLIYQSDYIVNWDPVLQSAISDAEVEHKEVNGNFYHILYSVKDSDEKIEIATTRPETLVGDTAVAVNPNDERYKHLIGKKALVPLVNREVPIIGDEHADPEKGTGALKVTPAHDFNDFEIGQRHNLESILIMQKDGTFNKVYSPIEGMKVKQAREKICEELKDKEILIDIKPCTQQVGHGDRSKAVIEPMVSKQWFLNVQEMSQEAVSAIEDGRTTFYPKGWENTYFSWLREPRNWCISRQLWWGHQIPVFTCTSCQHQWASEDDNPKECPKCSHDKIEQDPDVLDTWFSSGLWPMSTLGWPDPERMKKLQFEKFFPTSTLVTGFDIIFFWVARMMMMSLKAKQSIPFDKIYIHAIVRDKLGRKMSKSLGNGIDPLDMVDQYGADALRFVLAAGSGYNRNLNLDPERIEGYRNFINKIWNAFRFAHPFIKEVDSQLPSDKELDSSDKWILEELNLIKQSMNNSLEEFRFDDSCSEIYAFTYDKLCSWFLELSKPILYGDDENAKTKKAKVLKYVFREMVKLLHPVSPFLTEEIWVSLKEENEDLLISQDYPEFSSSFSYEKEREEINKFIDLVVQIRNLRQSVNLKPQDEIEVHLFSEDKTLEELITVYQKGFFDLARVKKVSNHSKDTDRPGKSIFAANSFAEIFIPLEGVIDLEAQKQRLSKKIEKLKAEVNKIDKKLSNPKFVDNAPADVVEEVKDKGSKFKAELEALESNLSSFL